MDVDREILEKKTSLVYQVNKMKACVTAHMVDKHCLNIHYIFIDLLENMGEQFDENRIN